MGNLWMKVRKATRKSRIRIAEVGNTAATIEDGIQIGTGPGEMTVVITIAPRTTIDGERRDTQESVTQIGVPGQTEVEGGTMRDLATLMTEIWVAAIEAGVGRDTGDNVVWYCNLYSKFSIIYYIDLLISPSQ